MLRALAVVVLERHPSPCHSALRLSLAKLLKLALGL